jgi:hypothetical protein
MRTLTGAVYQSLDGVMKSGGVTLGLRPRVIPPRVGK